MNRKFTDLSKLKFDEIEEKLKEKLQRQKIQERPFAYEFYHQFRKLWDNGCIAGTIPKDIVIQAEVNKNYQQIPDLKKIPDFLLHRSSSDKNFAVIEFKLASNYREIEKDFEKLIAFKQILNYMYVIEVIIGRKEPLKTAIERIKTLNNPKGKDIIIIEFNTDSWNANDFRIKYKSNLT